jgi:hypothetical protein
LVDVGEFGHGGDRAELVAELGTTGEHEEHASERFRVVGFGGGAS